MPCVGPRVSAETRYAIACGASAETPGLCLPANAKFTMCDADALYVR